MKFVKHICNKFFFWRGGKDFSIFDLNNIDENEKDAKNTLEALQEELKISIKEDFSKYELSFDQMTNLRENIRLTRNILESFDDIDGKNCRIKKFEPKDVFLSRLGQIAAAMDPILDIYGAFNLWNEGYFFLSFFSMFLLILNCLIQCVRIVFIGKENYNIRKWLIMAIDNTYAAENYPRFKNQRIVDTWNSILRLLEIIKNKLIQGFWRLIFSGNANSEDQENKNTMEMEEIISITTPLTDISLSDDRTSPSVSFESNSQIGREKESYIQSESISTDLECESISHTTASENLEKLSANPSVKLINESFPNFIWHFRIFKHTFQLRWYCFLLAPSVLLANNYIRDGKKLNKVAKAFRDNKESKYLKLQFLYRAISFEFLKFECAEMKKTEVFLETVPQFIIRLIPIIYSMLENGYIKTSSNYEIFIFLLSLFFLSLGIVTASLDKLAYYFKVYKKGDNYKKPLFMMPPYGAKLIICIIANCFTLLPILTITALSPTSIYLSVLPFTILFLSIFYIFWKTTSIPFYSVYGAALEIFTSFSPYTEKCGVWELTKKNFKKITFVTIALLILTFILSFQTEYKLNLCIFSAATWMICLIGLILEILDRYIWRLIWGGEAFDEYTGELELDKESRQADEEKNIDL